MDCERCEEFIPEGEVMHPFNCAYAQLNYI